MKCRSGVYLEYIHKCRMRLFIYASALYRSFGGDVEADSGVDEFQEYVERMELSGCEVVGGGPVMEFVRRHT